MTAAVSRALLECLRVLSCCAHLCCRIDVSCCSNSILGASLEQMMHFAHTLAGHLELAHLHEMAGLAP